MTKDEILSFIYLDKSGYGSVAETYKEARKKDKTITMQDVKDFISKHQEQKKQLRGYNSFIAQEPKQEYQVDLFFLPKRFSYRVLYWRCYCYRYLHQMYYNNTN